MFERLAQEVIRTVRAAVRSWPETVRLCLLLLFAAAAGAVFLTVLVGLPPSAASPSAPWVLDGSSPV